MDKQYDNEKRIAVFPNDKGGNDKRPDWRGTLTLGGKEWKVSLWDRQTKTGKRMLSGSIEEPQPKQGETAQQQPRPAQPQQEKLATITVMKADAADSEDVPF